MPKGVDEDVIAVVLVGSEVERREGSRGGERFCCPLPVESGVSGMSDDSGVEGVGGVTRGSWASLGVLLFGDAMLKMEVYVVGMKED